MSFANHDFSKYFVQNYVRYSHPKFDCLTTRQLLHLTSIGKSTISALEVNVLSFDPEPGTKKATV